MKSYLHNITCSKILRGVYVIHFLKIEYNKSLQIVAESCIITMGNIMDLRYVLWPLSRDATRQLPSLSYP